LVHLDASWREALSRHHYPVSLRNLLGEMMAAATLLTGTLKLDGVLTMQIQGGGPVTLAVVECSSDRKLRGLVRWQEGSESEIVNASWRELVGKGRMAITLEQRKTGERYQGIVDLSGNSLADALEHYLDRSEQLETRLFLNANETCAAGMLIQRMPETVSITAQNPDVDAWPRITQLAQTITPEELTELDAETIIHRLFHEETVRLFGINPVSFYCSCTRERVQNTLRMLGIDEMRSVLQEQGTVSVNCEFCNHHYEFDSVDIEALFSEAITTAPGKTRH
jgi:molecular chaperone Hsp33